MSKMLRIVKSKNSENTTVSKNSDDINQSSHELTNDVEITNVENNLSLSSEKINDQSNNTLLMEELKELTESPTPFVSRQNTQNDAEMTSSSIRKHSNDRETAKTNTTHERNSQKRENVDACTMMVTETKIKNTPHTEEREDDEESVVINSICEAIYECESSVSDDISTINDEHDDNIDNSNANNRITHESNVPNEINSVNEIMHHAACTAASRLNMSELKQENMLLSVEDKGIMHIHEHYKLRHMLNEHEEGMHCTCFALAAPCSLLEQEEEEWKQEHHKRQEDIESKRVHLAVGNENGAILLYNTSFVEIGRCTINTSSSSSSLLRLPSTLTRQWRQLMRSSLSLRSKSNNVNDNTETKQTAVRCMSIPLDERMLVAGYANKSVILWSLQTHSPLKVIHDVFDCPLRVLYHLHPYSNRIMCCDERGAIHLLLYNIILGKVMNKNIFLIAAGASCALDVIPVWTVSMKQLEECEEEEKEEHLSNKDTYDRVSNNVNTNGVCDDSECMSTKYYYGKSFKISVDVNAGKEKQECWHVVPNRHLVATVHDCYLSLYLVHSGLSAFMHKLAEYTHASDWRRQSQRHATRDRYGNKINSINEKEDKHSQAHVQFIVQSPRFNDNNNNNNNNNNNRNKWEESAVNNNTSKRKVSKNYKSITSANKRVGEGKDEVSYQQTKIPITLCAAWGHEVVLFDVNSELIYKSRTAEIRNECVQLVPLLSIGSIHLLAEPSCMMHAMCVISGTCLLVVMTQPCSANTNNSYSVMNDALIFLIDVAAGLIVEKYHYNAKYIGMTNINKKINNSSSDNNYYGERCRSAETNTFKSTIAVLANREVVMLASPLHVWTCRVKPWSLRVEKLITRHRFEEALEFLQEVVEEVALAAVRVPTSREELKRECSVLLQEIAMAYVESVIHTPNVEQFLYSKTQMEMLQRVMRRILSVCVTLDLMDVYYHHIIPCLVEHHLTCEAYMVLEEFIIKHVINSVPKEELIILICWIAEKCQDENSCSINRKHDNDYMLNECESQRRMENVLLNLNNNATTTLIDVAVQFHLVWARITLMALRQNKIVHALRVALTHDEDMLKNACISQVNKNGDNSSNFSLLEERKNCTKSDSLALLSIKYISCVLLDKSFVEYKEYKEQMHLEQWERQMEEEWVRGMTLQADIRVHAKRELWSYLLSSSSTSNTESPLLRLFALHPSATVEILLPSLKDNSRYSPWDAQSSAKAHQVQIEGVATLLEIVTDGVVDKSKLFIITSDNRHTQDTNKIDNTINDIPEINFIPELLSHKSSVPYNVIHKIVQTIVELLLLVEAPEIEHYEEYYEEEQKQQIQITTCMSYVKEWDLLTELVVRDYTFTFDNLTTLQERKQLQRELNKFIHLLVTRQNTIEILYSYLLKVFTMKGMGICLAFLYCCMHKYDKAIDCVLDARMCVIDEYLHYNVFEILREELERLQGRQGNDKSNSVEIKSTVSSTITTSSCAINTTLLNDWWHAIIERLSLLKATYAIVFAIFILQSIATLRYKSHKGIMPSLLVTTDRKLFNYLHFLQECIKHNHLTNSHSADDNHEETLFFELLRNEYIQNYYIALMAEYSPNELYMYTQELEKYNVIYDRTLAMHNASTHGIHDVEILLLEQERKYDDAFALLQRIITAQLEQLHNKVRVKCCQGEECKKEVKYDNDYDTDNDNDNDNDNEDTEVKHAVMSELECNKSLQHYIQVGAHLCESIMEHSTNICKSVKQITTSFAEVRSRKTEQIITNSNNEYCYCYNKDSYWVKLLNSFVVPRHSLATRLHLIKSKLDVERNTVTHTVSEINGEYQEHELRQELRNTTTNISNNNKNDKRCGDDLDVYFSQFDCQSCESNSVNESKQNKVKCEEHQEQQEQEEEKEEFYLSTEAQLTWKEGEHSDKTVTNIQNNESKEIIESEKSMEAVIVLTEMITCLTHLFEYTVECLLPFVDLPSLLFYLEDASVNEPLTFYKLSLVKTLYALHRHESIQEQLCCWNTNESDDVRSKRLLLTGMNSGVVPLSDRCFLCHARLTDAANEELSKTMEMYLSTQRIIDRIENTIFNNNSNNSKGSSVSKLEKKHNAHTSICVFHCGHVYHEVCQVRMSTACGENRCVVCLLEKEQQQQQGQENNLENILHTCQDTMKPITVNIDTSNKNDIGNVNNVENGKTQNKSEITTRVLRRLRQVNTLLNETSDYYNILKGYIEPDDTLCSSLPKRYHELQTTQKVTDQHKQKYQQEEHNVTKNNKQEPKSNNTSDKTRKVTCLSAVDDPHLLDLQIGKLTDDDILQLFDA